MFEWWNSLSFVAQVFACVAIPSTAVLIIQTILMLVGIGSDNADAGELDSFDGPDSDIDIMDGDVDPSGMEALRIFSVRGIISFLVIFGWVGFVIDHAGGELWLSIPIAIASGAAMMVIVALLMRSVMKLKNSGNLDNRNAIGVSGTVYLTVPAERQGTGKVSVLFQGTYSERNAVTDDTMAIPTGSEIVVIGISGNTTLVVRRK